MNTDWIVVGAGFAGSVLSERIASQLKETVLLIDQRDHIGGNAYDLMNCDGILYHQYGPHIFHTNSKQIFDYLSLFTDWRPYEHRVLACVNDKLVPFPINLRTVNTLYDLSLNEDDLQLWYNDRAEHLTDITSSEDVIVSRIGRDLFNKFFKNYTKKQWGVYPSALDKSVTSRIPVRTNDDDRYFTDEFQYIPLNGYTAMFKKMLDHDLIRISLNTPFKDCKDIKPKRGIIYTGPIDSYFDHCFGKLPYRSLEFQHVTLSREFFQSVGTVNYPNIHEYTRITEYKHITGQKHSKTTITFEYPTSTGEPYYPIPNRNNHDLFKKYEMLANKETNTWFVGRLANYRYYNMDQVIGQAFAVFKRITESR